MLLAQSCLSLLRISSLSVKSWAGINGSALPTMAMVLICISLFPSFFSPKDWIRLSFVAGQFGVVPDPGCEQWQLCGTEIFGEFFLEVCGIPAHPSMQNQAVCLLWPFCTF